MPSRRSLASGVLAPNRAADTSAGVAPEGALTMGSFRKGSGNLAPAVSTRRGPASMVHSGCQFDAPISASTCLEHGRGIPNDPSPNDGAESEQPALPACP